MMREGEYGAGMSYVQKLNITGFVNYDAQNANNIKNHIYLEINFVLLLYANVWMALENIICIFLKTYSI